MNRRQKLKRLKSDNKLMRNIIRNSPQMEDLYKSFNSPLRNITHTTMTFEKLKSAKYLPFENEIDGRVMEGYQNWLADEVCELVKNYVKYDINRDSYPPKLEATLYVGVTER